MIRTSTVFRTLALSCSALALASCTPEGPQTREVDGAGGSVRGPDGVSLHIPAGAVSEPTVFAVSRLHATGQERVSLETLCDGAYTLSPAGTRLAKAVRVVLPASCEGGTVLASRPGNRHWSAFAAERDAEGRYVAEVPFLGVVGVGRLDVVPDGDTTLYVGGRIHARVLDARGRAVSEATTALRTSDKTVIAPDHLTGLQQAKREGMAILELHVPSTGLRREIGVQVVKNPAAELVAIRGDDQVLEPGQISDSVVVEVFDAQDAPLGGVWVDFVVDQDGHERVVASGPTADDGRYGMRWRIPDEPGTHRVEARVAGTSLYRAFHVTAIR